MQKYLSLPLVTGLVLLIAGCQSTSLSSMGKNIGNGLNPSYPAGASLGQSVQEALNRNGDPDLAQVRVETNLNTVILSGYVKKIRQSDTAEQIARQVPGVQTVINNLVVRPS